MRIDKEIGACIFKQILCVIGLVSPLSFTAQDFKPTFSEFEQLLASGKSIETKALLFPKLIKLESLIGNEILKAQHYDLAGDYYFQQSDVGEALNYWYKSNALLKRSNASKRIYLAQNLANISKYYTHRILIDSAYLFAEEALAICRKNKKDLKDINAANVYREYGYTLKIKFIRDGKYLEGTNMARQYFDSALALCQKKNPKDLRRERKLLMDIGNTFTDEIIYYRSQNRMQDAMNALRKANLYYNNIKAICLTDVKRSNDELATVYQVLGLANYYCFFKDNLNYSLICYQKGVMALTDGYADTSIFSTPPVNASFINASKVLTLLRYKMDALSYLYQRTGDLDYLKACYLHSKVAIEIWKKEIQNLKALEIHQALETISAVPFGGAIPYSTLYYQISGVDSVAKDVFEWIDLNKYSAVLKNQIETDNRSIKNYGIEISEVQKQLTSKQAILEYFMDSEILICAVITNKSFKLFPIDTCNNLGAKIDSLLVSLKHHQEKEYCQQANRLFYRTVEPYLKDLSIEITDLTIIPHAKLSLLPFDALVLNNTNEFRSAEFLIKRYQINLALSCNLQYTGKVNDHLTRNVAFISPDFHDKTELPFSNLLIEDLKAYYNLGPASFDQNINGSSILHVATHAHCDAINSRNSYFLLSDEKKLYLHELTQHKLELPLAVLSACETGIGSIEADEGVINFSRQFYLAGIRSTITTLWKVDDESTSRILNSFYRELDEGQNSTTSLHHAKLNYLKTARQMEDFDPYYWSGLIYTGAPVSLKIHGSGKNKYYYFIGGCFVLILLVLIRKRSLES